MQRKIDKPAEYDRLDPVADGFGPSPFGVAQTIVQLFHELATMGFLSEDLTKVAKANELLTWLFGSQVRTSGRPFTCHAIGVASIAARDGADIHTVLASLLHAVYEFGDFGAHAPSAREKHRRQVRDLVGDEAEEAALSFYRFNLDLLEAHVDDMDALIANCPLAERRGLMVRVYNEIEQCPDIPYVAERHRKVWLAFKPVCVALAKALGRPDLAMDYARQLDEAARNIHPVAVGNTPITFPYLVPPASYTKKPSARLIEFGHNYVIAPWRRKLSAKMKEAKRD